MGKNKKKLAPNGQGGYVQKGTPTTNLSKATKARLEQINKKINDPEYKKNTLNKIFLLRVYFDWTFLDV